MELYGLTRKQAELSIYTPENDPGEWAPSALAILCFEYGDGLADNCGYWAPSGLAECFRLSARAGVGFVEWINPAVGAVYDA